MCVLIIYMRCFIYLYHIESYIAASTTSPDCQAETTGNTAMVLGNAVPMPLGMVQKMSLGLEVGIEQGYAVYAGTGGEPVL